VLKRARPGGVLAVNAVCASALAILSALTTGPMAAWSLIAVGLFNSIMFPTIFTLASENMGEETPNASALLVMAIVGGAIMPEVTGVVADHVSLAAALAVPAICYVWIVIYGFLTARGFGLAAQSA
jgi:FHS family L-fucose permease-like MFS transporter